MKVDMIKLRAIIETSWGEDTAYRGDFNSNNPSHNQCYPTSRVIQEFFPNTRIAKGIVWTGKEEIAHFWNILELKDDVYHIDFTWQQFPYGSVVRSFRVLEQSELDIEQQAIERVQLLLMRVKAILTESKR